MAHIRLAVALALVGVGFQSNENVFFQFEIIIMIISERNEEILLEEDVLSYCADVSRIFMSIFGHLSLLADLYIFYL